MGYDDCVRCGFKCNSICTVTRGTRKHDLHEFLSRYLGNGEAVAWACTGCRACDAVCPAETKPYQLIQAAMGDFLKTHENALSDYHAEYVEHGRIGASGVFLDDLVLPARAASRLTFLQPFDRVVVFPGCLVSARFPWLVHRLYQLLVLLGVDTRRIVVDEESCCGSFLQTTDDGEFKANGESVFKAITKKADKALILTACGSCTSTLRAMQARLVDGLAPKKVAGNPGSATIMHYAELLAVPECVAIIKPIVERLVNGRPEAREKQQRNVKTNVYFQFPCQAAKSPADRARVNTAVRGLLDAAGYNTAITSHDLGCCGAGLLETHPDLAIEYGLRRMTNITTDSNIEVGTIIVACGNCHRIFSDFKPAIETECDCADGIDVDVRFLLDMIMELFIP